MSAVDKVVSELLAGADIVSRLMHKDNDITYRTARYILPEERFNAVLKEIKQISLSSMHSPRDFFNSILEQLITLKNTQLTDMQFKELQDAMENAGCKYINQWGEQSISDGSLSGGSILIGNIISPTAGHALLNSFLEDRETAEGKTEPGYIEKWLNRSLNGRNPESFKAEDVASIVAPYTMQKDGCVIWAVFADKPVDVLLDDGSVLQVGRNCAICMPDNNGSPNPQSGIQTLSKQIFCEDFGPLATFTATKQNNIVSLPHAWVLYVNNLDKSTLDKWHKMFSDKPLIIYNMDIVPSTLRIYKITNDMCNMPTVYFEASAAVIEKLECAIAPMIKDNRVSIEIESGFYKITGAANLNYGDIIETIDECLGESGLGDDEISDGNDCL